MMTNEPQRAWKDADAVAVYLEIMATNEDSVQSGQEIYHRDFLNRLPDTTHLVAPCGVAVGLHCRKQ
jgi:hypothetical protein